MKLFVLALAFAALLASATAVTSGITNEMWQGEWTDHVLDAGGYGGSFYLCVDGNVVQGVYSEAGFVYGTVENSVFKGTWYEAGSRYDDGSANHGTFELRMRSSMQEFVGQWFYDGIQEPAGQWTAQRINYDRPSDIQCMRRDESITQDLHHVFEYNGGEFFMCPSATEGEYKGSYWYTSQTPSDVNSRRKGYEIGQCYLDNTLCTATYYEGYPNMGSSLIRLINEGDAYEFWWRAVDFDWATRFDIGHGQGYLKVSDFNDAGDDTGEGPTELECTQYDEYEWSVTQEYLDVDVQNVFQASAGMLSVSAVVVVALAFAAVFV